MSYNQCFAKLGSKGVKHDLIWFKNKLLLVKAVTCKSRQVCHKHLSVGFVS